MLFSKTQLTSFDMGALLVAVKKTAPLLWHSLWVQSKKRMKKKGVRERRGKWKRCLREKLQATMVVFSFFWNRGGVLFFLHLIFEPVKCESCRRKCTLTRKKCCNPEGIDGTYKLWLFIIKKMAEKLLANFPMKKLAALVWKQCCCESGLELDVLDSNPRIFESEIFLTNFFHEKLFSYSFFVDSCKKDARKQKECIQNAVLGL